MILKILVPAGEGVLGIAPGSAIVGTDVENGKIMIDFEGGIYGQVGFDSFDRRAMQAAGRHVAEYPTSSRMIVDASDVEVIGLYDTDSWSMDVQNPAALQAWLGTRS